MNNNKLIMKYPAAWHGDKCRDATYLGNGMLGALVYGSIWEETITLTHTDLYYRSHTPELPDVSHCLPEIRKSLLENKPFVADQIMSNELKARGYQPKMALPLPLCNLVILSETENSFKNYRRVLDMDSGEALTNWCDGKKKIYRNCFTSRADDILALEFGTENNMPITATFSLEMTPPPPTTARPLIKDSDLPQDTKVEIAGNIITFTAKNYDGTIFGAICSIEHSGGVLSSDEKSITVTDFTNALLKVKVFIKSQYADIANVKTSLLHITKSYSELLSAHHRLHSALMNSSTLDLCDGKNISNEELLLDAYGGNAPLELIEKLWNFGKYLLISASCEYSNPCTLLGLWSADYHGFWAWNMVNENLQMIYWQALSANMPELMLPVFSYMERLIPDFRENARKLYGCRGIYIPAPTMPDTGICKSLSPHILHWTGGAGWVASHFYDFYLCTDDKDFLQNRAVPFLKEIALFYEDFFVLDDNGYYMSIPSNSPENSPGNYWDGKSGMGIVMETTMNATMDFAIAKEVLTNLVSGCAILGIETDNITKWQEMLGKIPEYHINEDGALKEWMHEFYKDNYRHRHQSHLYPLFPGNEIHRFDEDKTFYNACNVAAKKRLVIGLNQQSGWSLAHLAHNYARTGESELALDCVDLTCQSMLMNNLVTLHNDWREMGIGVKMSRAPVQLDANMGLVSAINEMLLQSYQDKIIILPALPRRFVKGSVTNLLTRQAVKVSITWDEENIQLTLCNNETAKTVNVIFSDTQVENISLDKNELFTLERKR